MAYILPGTPIISVGNSTVVALAGGASFTGTAVDVLQYSSISVALAVSGAGASGTLFLEFSSDGANWDLSNAIAVAAASSVTHNQITATRWYRTRYVNGAAPQATFRVQTILDGAKTALAVSRLSEDVSTETDVNNVRAIIVGQRTSGQFQQVGVDAEQALQMAITSPISAFGEVATVTPTPIFQIDASPLVLPSGQVASTFASGAGASAGMDTNRFSTQSGTDPVGIAYLQSLKPLRYRTGQGSACRFTAVFDAVPRASSLQAVGLFSPENGFAVGYDGLVFGFLQRSGGLREVRTLTVTVGAGGVETITITLAGATKVFATPGALAVADLAALIATQDFSTTGMGWLACLAGSTVIFTANPAGPLAGAFTLASTGTATGAFATTVAGVAATDAWIPQTSWNVDRLDGSGGGLNPTGMLLVPSLGSVWEISFQWLGFGAIILSVEDPVIGRFSRCHIIRFGNTVATPSIANPNVPLRMEAANSGSVNSVRVMTASLAAYIQGAVIFSGPRMSFGASKLAVGSALIPIFSLRVRPVRGGRTNLGQAVLAAFSACVEGTKLGRVVIVWRPTLVGTPVWTAVNSDSWMDADTAATGYTGGFEIQQTGLSRTGAVVYDLALFNFSLAIGDILTVAAAVTSTNSDFNASLTWYEQ